MKKRNVGAGPVSAQGITLIALIITIVVMMILVAVTVTFTIGENGIFSTAKESKFKQEVSQLLEFVGIERQAVIAEWIGNGKNIEEISYDPTILTQSVPTNLAQKYLDSGKLEASAKDGKIYYNSANLEPIEIEWLKELGITEKTGFRAYVEAIAADPKEKIQGYANFRSIGNQIETEYKNALVAVMVGGYTQNIGYDMEMVYQAYESYVNAQTEDNKLLIEQSAVVVAYGDDILLIDSNGNVKDNDSGYIPISEDKANELFEFREISQTELAITAYKGTEQNLKIPTDIYNEDGERIKRVTTIDEGAFMGARMMPIPTLMCTNRDGSGWTDLQYIEATLSELYEELGDTYPETGTNGDSTNCTYKNDYMISKLGADAGIDLEKYVEYKEYTDIIQEDGNTAKVPYLYINEEGYPVENENEPKLSTVEIPYNIIDIKENAFAYQNKLTTVKYWMQYPGNHTFSNYIFEGCYDLTKINIAGSIVDLSKHTISGMSNYWGAPNENIQIIDSYGNVK